MGLEDIPSVNWPTEFREYKVVQVKLDKRHFIRFGFCTLHSILLDDFLKEAEIKPERFKDRDAPLPNGERYCLSGAGFAYIDPDKKIAMFYGSSRGYDIHIDCESLAKMQVVSDWQLVTPDTHKRVITSRRGQNVYAIKPNKQ
jgi:hypothetical protein